MVSGLQWMGLFEMKHVLKSVTKKDREELAPRVLWSCLSCGWGRQVERILECWAVYSVVTWPGSNILKPVWHSAKNCHDLWLSFAIRSNGLILLELMKCKFRRQIFFGELFTQLLLVKTRKMFVNKSRIQVAHFKFYCMLVECLRHRLREPIF